MKAYIKGARIEREYKKQLEQKGDIVFRTAGSHGMIDLISISISPEKKRNFLPTNKGG